MSDISLHHYLAASIALASIGIAGVMVRRSILIILTSIQLTLMASALAVAAFSYAKSLPQGKTLAMVLAVVAAVEVLVGLTIAVAAYRTRPRTSIDDFTLMKG
jgi:NADH-quinone oxidoreductase subunit K